jgi:hypothetical protein
MMTLVAAWLPAQDEDEGAEQPQSNVYAIVKTGDGRLQVIRAKEVEKKDPALWITNEEGQRNARQLNMLIDVLPFYVEEDQDLPDDNISNIVAQYDNLIKNYPELKKSLVVDRTKYHTILEARKTQQAEKEKEKEKMLKEFTVTEFDEAKDYTPDELDGKLGAGEQLKGRYADLASAIDDYLKPWMERQALLKAGKVRWDGEWRTRAEIHQAQETRRAERMQTFADQLKPVIVSNTVASQTTMVIVAVFLALTALVALFSFYYAVFQSRIGGFLEFIMLIVSVLFMGFYTFYAVRIFNAPGVITEETGKALASVDAPAKTEEATDPAAADAPRSIPVADHPLGKLLKMLYISQGDTMRDVNNSDLLVELSDAEINTAINRLVQFRQDTVSGSLGVALEKVHFQAFASKLRFQQQTSCLGKNFLFQYDLHFQANNEAITFYKCDVTIGNTAIPSAIGNRLWLQFYGTIKEVLKAYNIANNYRVQKIEDGKVTAGYNLPGT